MSLLLPDSGLLFWMTLVFLVVFFVLWKWGFPSIIKMVNERKEYIDESLAKAEEANLRLANIQKQGEELLMEAREKQAQILREASETRDTIVGQAQEKAHEESARILSEAKAEIESQKQAAIRDIRAQVAELSVQIAEKILQKELSTSAEQTQFIDRLLDDVTSTNGTESK
ncbi:MULTISPECIES: F0F1 ATP synthase subunit B [Prevotella]|jgi:ATP synthase F0, B subunit|uniref:F0F1 ATP synthase subunit B n=1 Tax=Prevotella TaxID=838 RepID=UPI0002237658|nr:MULTISPECIES: F0F1 ATP synthase subunit B [Prevotella]EGW48221.1 ATP synthase F0, B subunit [Prevotella sp. C561]MBW4772121.1 F0F1 ATP synthase subunit B [Prevotella jejuni]QUB79887.1 F0F1 ATP synthase subunit B [Prevotella jejuni]QUB82213.1 F0F1 ATP synthase subunit B [Prevotella jejuni]